MSTCRWCGDRITWVKRPDGNSYYPPFEVTDRTEFDEYILEWRNGVWHATPIDDDAERTPIKLLRHKCEQYEQKSVVIPKDWDNHEVHLKMHDTARLAFAERNMQLKCEEKHYTLEQLLALSVRLSVNCPKCRAKKFEWCCYVNTPQDHTKVLHKERR